MQGTMQLTKLIVRTAQGTTGTSMYDSRYYGSIDIPLDADHLVAYYVVSASDNHLAEITRIGNTLRIWTVAPSVTVNVAMAFQF